MTACKVCGLEHAPLDPNRRYPYATAPGTDAHAWEVEWYAQHGIAPTGLTQVEAFAMSVPRTETAP